MRRKKRSHRGEVAKREKQRNEKHAPQRKSALPAICVFGFIVVFSVIFVGVFSSDTEKGPRTILESVWLAFIMTTFMGVVIAVFLGILIGLDRVTEKLNFLRWGENLAVYIILLPLALLFMLISHFFPDKKESETD